MTGRWANSDRAGRLPRNWRQIKAAVWKRDGDICWWCGRGGAGPGAGDIDHKRPGDDHSLENLGPIHSDPCHKIKTGREASAARWKHKQARPVERHPGTL